jgi:hypothetical protein
MKARPVIKVRILRDIGLKNVALKEICLSELELGLSDRYSLAGLGLKQINQQPLLPFLRSF